MKNRIFTLTPPKNRLIGHRGVAAKAPENTLASFKLAAEQHIDWIEFDVQLTSDDFLVIFHDDTLERTTNGTGWIYEHTLLNLLSLDAGSWFGSEFTNERIPELASTLVRLLPTSMQFNIELKVPEQYPARYLERFAEVFSHTLMAIWPPSRPGPLISSFDWTLLNLVKNYLPNTPVGYLSDTCRIELLDKIIPIHNAAFHCHYLSLNEELLAYAHLHSLPILTYTVNDPKIAHQLIQQGIFGIFSDDPCQILKELPLPP